MNEQLKTQVETVKSVERDMCEFFEINGIEIYLAMSAMTLLIVKKHLELDIPLERFIELTKIMIKNYKDLLKAKKDMDEST